MSNLPQPADRRHLRVSDADREQAAETLRQAAGDGRITFDELDQRLEAAYAARTYGDLSEVTADLPASGEQRPGALDTAPGTFPAARIGGEPGSGVSVAILGGVDRGGAGWFRRGTAWSPCSAASSSTCGKRDSASERSPSTSSP